MPCDRRRELCQPRTQASVLGREFALDALEQVFAEPEARFLQCVDEATAARVVAEVPGVRGRLRFSHVLYDRLGAARRARLHGRAGETLEALYARDPGSHLAELAYHFLEASAAGTPGKAVKYARGAAERAASALAYEEAVRLYQIALQAHSREEEPDARIRCELLLALGDAQTRAGDTPAAKQAFLLAAELARHGRATRGVMARAALGYGGRFLFNVSRDDPRLRPLLEEALADLGDGDSELRAMLLARLAGGPLRDEPSRERRASMSEQAVDMARRLGDPALLGYVLDGRFLAICAADTVEERLAIAAEMVQLSEATGDLERLFQGHMYRTWTLLQLGDLTAVQAQIGIASRIADDLRQPAQLWMVAATRTLCALLEGRFEQAGELMEEAFRLGERAIPWNAAVTRHLQLFALQREQGRLDELEKTVRCAVQAYPTYLVWRCVLADLYVQLGRQDDARAEFERFAAGDFTGLQFNEEWLLGMALLADVCAALGDVPRAGRLHELLLPYRELHAVVLPEISFGAVARALGKLAATAGRFEQATRHFEAAIQLNEQSGARPWTAHARHDYARMLAARGDRQQAHQQLAQALATYCELGMDRWADNTLSRDGSTLPT
jgi:tetratricopeptide (TPR) repeat protein